LPWPDWESNWATLWPPQVAPLGFSRGCSGVPQEVCRECLSQDERDSLRTYQEDIPF